MTLVNRWYQILELLVSAHEVEIEHLRQELGISQQTLVKTIAQLNDMLDGDAEIILNHSNYHLHVYDYSRLETILQGSLRRKSDFNSASKRVAYIIKRLIESDNYISIDDLADDIAVSRGTVIKDLKTVKKIAHQFSSFIVGKPNNGIKVEGSELNLRLMYIHHVFSYFELHHINAETIAFLSDLYQKYHLPRKIQELMTKSISLTIERVASGHLISSPMTFSTNEFTSNALMTELIVYMEIHYKLTLSQYEQAFLNFPLTIQYIDGLGDKNDDNDNLYHIYLKLVKHIKAKLLVTFDEELLYGDIQNHLKYLINRLIFHVPLGDIFQGEIKDKYPLAFEMANVAAEVLEEEFGQPLLLSERSYLALYFEMVLRNPSFSNRSTKKKIAVVCTTGRGTANIICKRLNQVLGQEIEISQFSEESFTPEQDNYFAIFTTIPLKFEHLQSPIVQITNLFDDQWLQNEWQRVTTFHKKHLESTVLKFLRLSCKHSYAEYLQQMTDNLVMEELVDDNFYQRLLDRESIQSTLFGNGIAFPHTINNKEEKIVLMLGLLNHAYVSNNKSIEFIFMVAIPKTVTPKIESELIELYDDIFKIASNDAIKEELRQISSEGDFYDFVKEKEVF